MDKVCAPYNAEPEIAVGHWLFSDQFQDLAEQKYRIAKMFAVGKFGKFGESSVFRQTLTNQILAYKWYPYGNMMCSLKLQRIHLSPNYACMWCVRMCMS